jgi:hypothetical protein
MTRRAEIERLARFMGFKAGIPVGGEPFNPFDNIEHAMMVAEKIGGLSLSGCRHKKELREKFNWMAAFTRYGYYASTAAEAVTLAALAHLSATEGK